MNRTQLMLLLAAAVFLIPGTLLGKGNPHIGHVATSWGDTPGKVGLITALETEAGIADFHAGLMVKKTDHLGWMKTHVRHVRHAIDPSSEKGGPGKGYGVLKAGKGVVAHIGFAAKSKNASQNITLHAVHISTATGNVVAWAEQVLQLSEKVLSAKTAKAAAGAARKIASLTTAMTKGQGGKSWKKGEGGVTQAMAHLGFLKQGEGM